MIIGEEAYDRIRLLVLSGRLDASSSDVLATRIDALVETGWSRLVLDCGDLASVTSVGLRVLLVGAKKTRAAGGALACCRLQPVVEEVFALSRIGAVLEIHPDRVGALEALA